MFDIKKREDRERLAELLLNGYTQEQIGRLIGYSKNTVHMMMLRAGGTDQFLEETMGADAVKQYRARLSNQRRESGSEGGRISQEKDLTTDVAEDLSVAGSRSRLDDLGTPEREPRITGPRQGLHVSPSHGAVEKKIKAFLSACERAAAAGQHKVEIQQLVDSFTKSVMEGDAVKSLVPIVVSSYESQKTGPVLVLRVRRLTKAEAQEAGDRGKKIDEFIGTLMREINRVNDPDSPLGAAFRARGFTQVHLQTSMMGAPVELLVKNLS